MSDLGKKSDEDVGDEILAETGEKQETRKFSRQHFDNECNKNIQLFSKSLKHFSHSFLLTLLEIFSSDLKSFRNYDYLKRCKIPSIKGRKRRW